MTFAELLNKLLPDGVYSDAPTSVIQTELGITETALETTQAEALELLGEALPDTTVELLTGWERIYEITSVVQLPYAIRIQNLLAKVLSRGGLSKQYFIDLAKSLGYTITISEFVPFMAGWSESGIDTVYVETIVYCWEVVVDKDTAQWFEFYAGSARAGEPLGLYSNDFFENLLTLLKPAHTFVNFVYQ